MKWYRSLFRRAFHSVRRDHGNRTARHVTLGLEHLENRLVLTFNITQLPLTSLQPSSTTVTAIATGPDNNIWYARIINQVTESTPTSSSFVRAIKIDRVGIDGTATEFDGPAIPAAAPSRFSLTTGPDGNLWLTEPDNHALDRITPAGVQTTFSLPDGPLAVTSGPDNSLWFTGFSPANQPLGSGSPEIARYSLPSSTNPDGAVTRFSAGLSGIPSEIILGSDGNLWFTEAAVQKIGKISPGGTITEYPISGATPFDTFAITAGPDGNVWFTDQRANTIGRITPAGEIAVFALPTADAGLGGITTGADGNLWFVEGLANKIGHMNPNGIILDELTIPSPGGARDISSGPNGTVLFNQTSLSSVIPDQIDLVNGITQQASGISGTVFLDFNHNGQQDPNESGLLGKTVYLDLNQSGQLAPGDPAATTDVNGHYTIPGIPPGTYTLRQVILPAYAQDAPPAPGSYRVTVPAGPLQANLNFSDQPATTLLAAPSPQSLFGGSNPDALTAFVRAQYLGILRRVPDALGLAYWVKQLSTGTTHEQVTKGLWNSDEHNGEEVDRYFQTFFHRTADPTGRAFWIQQLQSGVDEAVVIQAFLTAPEYQRLHSTDASFVQALYNDVLGRAGESSGVTYWLNLLQTGVSRAVVAQGFVHSAESYGVAVDTYFTECLERAPGTPEKIFWVNQLGNGSLSFAGVALHMLDSNELLNRTAQTVA